jgi:hypothetical protein
VAVIAKVAVIANAVKQSMTSDCMDCHGLRPRDDGAGSRSCAVSNRIRGLVLTGFGCDCDRTTAFNIETLKIH